MALRASAFLIVPYAILVLAEGSGDNGDEAAGGEQGGDEDPSQSIVLAHGVLLAALFAVFFPLGAIIIRISKYPNVAWIHGIWQIISYVGALAGFGIGAYLATVEDEWTTDGHAIIGTIVVGLLLFQPLGGFLHHRMYKKYKSPTTYGYIHRWCGRGVLVLGVINGGLGLWLADEDKNFIIPYSVVAGVMYVTWAVIVIRKKKTRETEKRLSESSQGL